MVAVSSAQAIGSSAHFQIFAPALDARVRWRLLSGNNRDMGRSHADFDSRRECLRAIELFQRSIDTFEPSFRRVGHQWSWLLLDEGIPQAVAGGSYDRRVRCEQSLAQFTTSVVDAPVNDDVMISMTRRWAAATGRRPVAGPISRILSLGTDQ